MKTRLPAPAKPISRALAFILIAGIVAACLPSCALKGRGDRGTPRSMLRDGAHTQEVPQAALENNELIVKASRMVAQIRGEHTVVRGMLFEVEQLQENLKTVEPGIFGRDFNENAVRDALRECWSEPLSSNPDFDEIPIDYADCDGSGLSDGDCANLSQTQLALTNVYDEAKSCAPSSLSKAKKFQPRTPQSALLFVERKVQEVDAIRILVDRIPGQIEQALGTLSQVSQQPAMLVLEVQNNPALGDGERQSIIKSLNDMLDVDLRGAEFELNQLSASSEERLDTTQDTVDEALSSYPLLGLP